MKSVSTNNGPRFFTIIDVANFLDVSPRTVRRWIKSELLVAHRFNGLVRISEADFQAFWRRTGTTKLCPPLSIKVPFNVRWLRQIGNTTIRIYAPYVL